MAFIDAVLLYIECKSGTRRPEEIEDSAIRNFLQRSQDLAPELAIMLVDTDSELDALVDRFQAILLPIQRTASNIRDLGWKPKKPFISRVVGFDKVFYGLLRVFVTYSQPSILHALQACLRYYHTYVKFVSFLVGPRINYISGEILER